MGTAAGRPGHGPDSIVKAHYSTDGLMYISTLNTGSRTCRKIALDRCDHQVRNRGPVLRGGHPQAAMEVRRYQAVELLGIHRRGLLNEGRSALFLTPLGPTAKPESTE